MTTQQPEALRLANILRGIDARSRFANERLSSASDALENQHARITDLESQLAQRFDAADVATAAAQGFRDGVASLSANAGAPRNAIDRDALVDAIAQGLHGTWHCTRVWEAWHVGTMSQDDFEPVDESETPTEIADAVLALLAAAPAQPAAQQGVAQQEAQEPATVPRFNCWSTNEGDSWFDHPADSQAIYDCLGNDAKVGDEYELTAGWKSVTARYRITEVVGDGEEYEVECISHPHENSAPQSPTAQAAESVPAVEREQERVAFKDAHRHLELYEVPDAWGRPMFKHSHVEASWLGWIARASHGQAPAGAALPESWVPLTIHLEGQYPEEVAYGPQIMMDRLGKWLGKYFAQVVQADSAQEDASDPLQGAANWLAEAHGQFSPVVLSGCLMIGYNRAKRLHDAALAARKQGASR